ASGARSDVLFSVHGVSQVAVGRRGGGTSPPIDLDCDLRAGRHGTRGGARRLARTLSRGSDGTIVIPRNGLIGEYLFLGNAQDTSGLGHHGVVHGAQPCADRFGTLGRAYRFDGVDDYIEVTPPPALNDRGFSVSVWARYERRALRGWTSCIVAQDNGNDADQSGCVFQLSTEHQHIVWHRMVDARDPMCKRRVRFGT